MSIQDSSNDLKTAQEDVTAGHGAGNGEGLGNETQAQQDDLYKQISALQAQADVLPEGSDEKEKIAKQIQALQIKEGQSR
ncbi:hypothetical protein FAI41_03295 [Acetobacteraceae bacterium]|nr:hypothetical protein FAI41_03295 [Acetobacteraceae bacterium]